ncbi:ATP-dependent DNA helicase Q1-like [Diretmus argenteus]
MKGKRLRTVRPRSVCADYVSECGLGSRDDHPADCIVYFGFADIFRISTMVVMENVGQKKLLQMVDYCQNVDRCRRSLMAVHFDEVWDDEGCNQMCDTCRHGKDCVTVDISQHAREVVQILELAASLDEKLTPLKVVEAWMGKGPAKRRKMIQTTTLPRLEVEAIIVRLLQQGYLGEDFSFTPYTTYFYLKLGRKAPLLKNQTHTLDMKMKKTGVESATRPRRKPHADAAAADIPTPPPGGAAANTDRQRPVLVNSPSQASFISETAAEELCYLRNYYSKQLRRINYISHEHLGQQSEPGVLACIREPLRSLRLPRGVTIARTARSLWTRVSGRRKLVHR